MVPLNYYFGQANKIHFSSPETCFATVSPPSGQLQYHYLGLRSSRSDRLDSKYVLVMRNKVSSCNGLTSNEQIAMMPTLLKPI